MTHCVRFGFGGLACALVVAVLAAADPTPRAAVPAAPDRGQEFLKKHCLECHSGAKPKGDVSLDTLTKNFSDEAMRTRWQAVLEQVQAGTMPPKAKPRPTEPEIKTLKVWSELHRHEADLEKRNKQGRSVSRRLSRVEYEFTIRDLLGIELELKELFPADSTANGFDTSGDAHHVSSFLMESYLEAADKALAVAIANAARPPLVKKRYSLKDERGVKVSTEKVFRQTDDALIMFSSSAWNAITVGQFYPPDRGRYRIRISAQAVQSAGKPVAFRVDAGPMLMGTKNHLVSYFDAPAEKPQVFEFVDHFEARNHIRISPYGLATAQTVNKIGADQYEGPGLAIQYVEVEGPLHETWPPDSHRRLFGDLPQGPSPVANNRARVEVTSKSPEVDAEKILRNFARRAFRRTPTEVDLQPYLAIVQTRMSEQYSFERAVRVALKAMLVSPDFLFLKEQPGKLDDFALASRLSYFFWSSMPDDTLLSLVEEKKLSRPEVLREQVERMLKHPNAARFVENFLGQWLGLREIDFTAPDFRLYPEYDDALKVAMLAETHQFFAELLNRDLGIEHLVASDFTFLNGRLAKHYGIDGVDGFAMRKVKLKPEHHRGGLMTMASVLKVTANGTNTSPVVRGAWVLDRILGTPPSPPPASVPAIEPDIRGATTIRDLLAKHRSTPNCNTCHAKIDPPGFALESYDVIGGWRENYRSIGRGTPVTLDGRRMPYSQGLKVDPSDVLPTGEKFRNIDEFKQLLLQDADQLRRSLAAKLITYSTGAAPSTADLKEIDEIVRKVRETKGGLRTLVHEVVQSPLFQMK